MSFRQTKINRDTPGVELVRYINTYFGVELTPPDTKPNPTTDIEGFSNSYYDENPRISDLIRHYRANSVMTFNQNTLITQKPIPLISTYSTTGFKVDKIHFKRINVFENLKRRTPTFQVFSIILPWMIITKESTNEQFELALKGILNLEDTYLKCSSSTINNKKVIRVTRDRTSGVNDILTGTEFNLNIEHGKNEPFITRI